MSRKVSSYARWGVLTLLVSGTGVAIAGEAPPAPVQTVEQVGESDLCSRDLDRVLAGFAARSDDRIKPRPTGDWVPNRFTPIAATSNPGGATCDGTPSCQHTCEGGGIVTCNSVSCGPGAWTCAGSGPTCSAGNIPTCDQGTTCFGVATCGGGPTCANPPTPTCGGAQPTCSYSPSCQHYGCLGSAVGAPGLFSRDCSRGAQFGVAFGLIGLLWLRPRRPRDGSFIA